MGVFQKIVKSFQRKKNLKSYLKNVKYSLKSHFKKSCRKELEWINELEWTKDLEETNDLE